ncbi:hypothetical protein [Streptomyces sp. NPDC052042]|uniref:hypothetical protein n=1 Tax=Streptomyces sp. NPDC052042 TaxID=3365683 RepID=UPI0037CD81A0
MTDHDETHNSPEKDQHETEKKPRGVVARLKRLYEDRPAVFAVLVIGASALVLLLGGLVLGESGFAVYLSPD